MQTWLRHKTEYHVLFSVLNVDTKESYSKVVSSCNFIHTVLNDVFNMYSVPFYKHILKTESRASSPRTHTSYTILAATNVATHSTKALLGKLHTYKQIAADWIWISTKLAR